MEFKPVRAEDKQLIDSYLRQIDSRSCDGMMSVSAVLSGMSEKLSRPDRTQMLEVCENSFEMHCHNCTMRKKCREKSAERIEKLKGDMASSLAKDGYVSAS